MTTNLNDHIVMNAAEAENLGFIIDGDCCFFFDLSCTVAVLSFNSLDEVWQFDTAVNEDGDSWQFTNPDLHTALIRAYAVAKIMTATVAFLSVDEVSPKDVDHVEILNILFAGCVGIEA